VPPKFVASLRSFWDERRARSTVIGLTPFERAQRSWARSIAPYADVPAEYASFFDPMRASGAPLPLVVIAPSYEGFLHLEVERLVCATADEIAVLERRGHRLESHRFPFSAISCVQMRSVLLDARLKIIGLEGADRIPAEISVRFNAVTEFLFAPIVARIRSAGAEPRVGTAEAAKVFEAWGKRNFKFMNYARRSLLGNEAVLQAILQPEIRISIVSAFGRSIRRTVSPTHATILTERELISIQEVAYPGDQERYGGVWDYIPLAKIAALSISANGRGLVSLSIQLHGETRFDLLFEPSAREDLDSLEAKFSEIAR
jgi:hypothetical protein